MSSTIATVLQALQERGEATRPQLAQATGLSAVTVGRIMEQLQQRGEAILAGEIPSGGGRPVQLYRFNSRHSYNVIIKLTGEGNILRGELEELDLNGALIHNIEGKFAYIDKESFDGWIDTLSRKHRINSITLNLPAEAPVKELSTHLHTRYGCMVHTPSNAALLAIRREGIATLYLPQGEDAGCAYYRQGKVNECGHLAQLPLPVDWQMLDFTDRTLLEEMVAKLIQIINCILMPSRIYLFAPIWNSRLTERIRYNASTKVKGKLPSLRFVTLPRNALQQALREYPISVMREKS